MDISHTIPTAVESVSFGFLSPREVRRLSVKHITNPQSLDEHNRPVSDGLYDLALGPSSKNELCNTCRLGYFTCPGHFGHIELPAPVFHPLFMTQMIQVIGKTCMYCHHFKDRPRIKAKYTAQLRLLDHGLVNAAKEVEAIVNEFARLPADDNEDDEDGGNTSGTEVPNKDLEKRLAEFVEEQLSQASGSRRDDYHDGPAYQARKAIFKEFLISRPKQCGNCGAKAFTHRKLEHTKIIELDLDTKSKDYNMLLGLVRPHVLDDGVGDYHATIVEDEDAEMQGSSDDGEDIEHSDNEKEVTSKKKVAYDYQGRAKGRSGRQERIVAPEEARAHLRRLYAAEPVLCALIFGNHGALSRVSSDISFASAEMFFMEVLSVPPARFRPASYRGGYVTEHVQSTLMANILRTSHSIREAHTALKELSSKSAAAERAPSAAERDKSVSTLVGRMIQLQVDVNVLMDSKKYTRRAPGGQQHPPGIKDILEKKQGLFRQNMMGKRVNYAARSVISPDVNIETNEIGVPPVFATTLTFPEPVTQHNVHMMRQLVINGPKHYPGANYVQYEDGTQQSLARLTQEQRVAIANQLLTPQEGKGTASVHTLTTRTLGANKKVYRHLLDGDCLIVNRQPTLHKPSMMVHKAKVLKGEKTIRMHYANCNSYNADFDGDEMNLHFPQSQVSRAEARFLANTDNQYLVPTSGKPLRGLIQDHVVAGVWMTYKETFFTREEYQQLIYGALKPETNSLKNGRIITMPPTIWKPQALWTGKQIISTIMHNITPENAQGMHLNSSCRILNSHWGKFKYTKDVTFADGTTKTMKLDGEESVIFYEGDLLCGILDKSQYGATAYGMVHSVYELYGSDIAGRLLGILSRLFTNFLQHRAFTCRMDDLLLTPEADQKRRAKLAEAQNDGYEAAIDNFPALKDMDNESCQLGEQLNLLLEEVLRDDSKMNDLDITVKKKMAELTAAVASASIPGLYRRFPENHMQTMVMSGAKGSAVNARQISAGLGQQELEGRRVPVMVSGKTLPSFKPLETAAIAGGYVASRFLTGIKPQEFYFHCMAGREGLIDTAVKTSRSGYLQRCLIKHLEGLRVHYDNTVRDSDSAVYQFLYGGDGLDVTKQMHLQQFDFAAANMVSFVERSNIRAVAGKVNDEDATKYMKKKVLKHPGRYPPPLSIFSPTSYLGATSETFGKAVDDYIKTHTGQTLRAKKSESTDAAANTRRKDLQPAAKFRDLMYMRYMKALAEPGEAVGLIAAQGVGEPSTQMTLNTFHFAGHGAANVTLGIPRLREIVMTAARVLKTPTMTLPINPGVPQDRVDAFCKRASRLTLSQVIEHVTVTESIVRSGVTRQRQFDVRLNFFPPADYTEAYMARPSVILDALGTSFPVNLTKAIRTELKKLGETIKALEQQIGQGKKFNDSERVGDDSDGEGAGDSGDRDNEADVDDEAADNEDEKSSRRRKEMNSYDDEESETESEDDASITGEDIEAAYASNSDGDETDVASVKSKRASSKEKWKKKLSLAQELFDKRCAFASSLKMPEKGDYCSFEVMLPGDTQKVLLVNIIEQACLKTIVRHIPGVVTCREFIPEKKTEGPKFMTEGCNLQGLWDYCQGEGDLDGLETNDIYAMLMTYGVESARETIIREMSRVFDVYSIKVDPRHLSIIADYMTYDGGFKAFNRIGIVGSSSVLLKASFEQTGVFLADATLHGDYDELTSPASSIVLGQPARSGTGLFGIQAPIAAAA